MPDGTQLRAFRLKNGRYRIYHLNTELQIYRNIISPETLKSKIHILFQNCDTLDFKDYFSEKLYLTCVATDNKRIYQQTISQIELHLLLYFEIFGSFHKYVCAYAWKSFSFNHQESFAQADT